MTFTDKGGTFDYLELTTTTNAFEYTFEKDFSDKTPIPAALPLMATGLGALGLFGWRRKRKTPVAISV